MNIITLALATLSVGLQQPDEMRLMRFPDIRGDQVVFTYASDLWLADTHGGYARRLTSHPGMEIRPHFSPDGKWIAFTGQYDGSTEVYAMPAEGGEPTRLTWGPDGATVVGWTPGGKVAYVSVQGSFTNRQRRLWLVSPTGGLPEETPVIEASEASFSPDGSKVAYNRFPSANFNWRRYRGGEQGVISFFDLKTGAYSELPHGRESTWSPLWVGNSIYFISDKNQNTVNLYRHDLGSGKTVQLTRYTDADIKWPSTDGKEIVFERDGYLYRYDIENGTAEKLAPKVLGDHLAARPALRKLGIADISISPSGVRVAVEARGEIFTVPAKNGETRNLTASQTSRERFPNWSPDGKTIAYTTDRTGSTQVMIQPQMGGEAKQVSDWSGADLTGLRWSPDSKNLSFTSGDHDLWILDPATKKATLVVHDRYERLNEYDWSPDSKWIAYISTGDNLFTALHLFEVATGKDAKVTEGYYRDDAVSFDLNGKYLYLVSARTFNPVGGDFEFNALTQGAQRVYLLTLAKDTPNPLAPTSDEETDKPAAPAGPGKGEGKPGEGPKETKIDLDGLGGRIVALPMPAGGYGFIVGGNNGVFYLGASGLSKFDLTSKESSVIMAGGRLFDFNPARTKLAYVAAGTLGISDIHPGIKPGDGKVETSGVEAVVDPKAEWKQMFWEAWRWERDHFYDKAMTGLDWKAIGDRYAKYLPYVSHRSDLTYVLGLMLGELGTSHAYVFGGDLGPMIPPVVVGMLGADYGLDSGHVKFKKIYRGESFEEGRRGPLGEPGINVNEGDYLLEIDGKEVAPSVAPQSLLLDKAGHQVTLTVNSVPSTTGARKVVVRPIASEGQLRYIDWVEATRRKVGELSGGKIGYMHVPDTSIDGVIEFLKGFYSQTDKEAMIVDERWNGGGMIPTFYIEKLSRHTMTVFRQRHGDDVPFPVQHLEGPKVMLINAYAGSGGDLFPWFFRQAKLGPLIGKRTWGGLVGITGGAPLVDGGTVTAPEFGLYDPATGKWIAENMGIDPDIDVDLRPDLAAQGRDPQLEKAVEVLMDELKKGKAPVRRPDFPKVGP